MPMTTITIMHTGTGTGTPMTDTRSVLRLMSWLSPVFPTGGYAYSAGLETAAAQHLVASQADLKNWLSGNLLYGDGRNDAVLFAAAWRESTNTQALSELASLASSLASSAERYAEILAQGKAFVAAAQYWPSRELPQLPSTCPLVIAVGASAGAAGLDLETSIAGYLHALITNQAQVAIRLSLIGQRAATRLLAALEGDIAKMGAWGAGSTLDDLGSAAILPSILSMQHETLSGRLFQS